MLRLLHPVAACSRRSILGTRWSCSSDVYVEWRGRVQHALCIRPSECVCDLCLAIWRSAALYPQRAQCGSIMMHELELPGSVNDCHNDDIELSLYKATGLPSPTQRQGTVLNDETVRNIVREEALESMREEVLESTRTDALQLV